MKRFFFVGGGGGGGRDSSPVYLIFGAVYWYVDSRGYFGVYCRSCIALLSHAVWKSVFTMQSENGYLLKH